MTRFNINCTLPPDGPLTFVSSPIARATLDIVLGCLNVLVIRTWSVLHLNVPCQSTPRIPKEHYMQTAYRLPSSVCWMLVFILALYCMLRKAWSDSSAVSSIEAAFAALSKEDGVPWARKHSFFAKMGDFSITFAKLQKRDWSTRPSSERTNIIIDLCQPPLIREPFGRDKTDVGTALVLNKTLQANSRRTKTMPYQVLFCMALLT